MNDLDDAKIAKARKAMTDALAGVDVVEIPERVVATLQLAAIALTAMMAADPENSKDVLKWGLSGFLDSLEDLSGGAFKSELHSSDEVAAAAKAKSSGAMH